MKTTRIGLATLGAIAAIGLTAPVLAAAPGEQPGAGSEKQTKEQPYQGKIEALDAAEKTFTVGGKVLYVTGSTKITRGDQPITMGDLKVGDDVNGMSRETFDGKTQAISVQVAAKGE